jgi:hypothetical protein
MEFDHCIHKELGYGCSCVRVFHWYEMCIFGQSIHNYHDDTVTLRLRQSFYEIHR